MIARLSIWFAALLVFGGILGGCATSSTKPGATLADKIHDDETAMKEVEADIKTKCGPMYSPAGVLAVELLTIATDAYAGDVPGAVVAAFAALPGAISDAKAIACVVGVVSADYKALK